jgi:hypothetical protein
MQLERPRYAHRRLDTAAGGGEPERPTHSTKQG